jgi:NADH-quinone oxidoreductase subunit B
MDAILKLHEQIKDEKLGAQRVQWQRELEESALQAVPTSEMKGLLR